MMRPLRFAPLCGLIVALGCSNDESSGKPSDTGGRAPRGGSSTTGGTDGGSTALGGRAPGPGTGGNASGGNGGDSGGPHEPPFVTDNLLVNGDAEQGSSGWLAAAPAGAIRSLEYGENAYPSAADPGPPERGQSFFDGGDNAATDSHQVVDVSPYAARIERGLRFELGAFLGGYLAQDDRAGVHVQCRAADGTLLASSTLGGPYAAERHATTGLFASTLDGKLPPLTASVDVHLVMTRSTGTGSDGYVDNVTLVLHD